MLTASSQRGPSLAVQHRHMDADFPTINDDSPAAGVAYSRRRLLAFVGGGAVTAITAGALVARWPSVAAAARSTTALGATTTDATTTVGTSFDTAWASGGTELITVDYPRRRSSPPPTPATWHSPPPRRAVLQSDTTDDIALGKTGLPMQLCAQLVDELRPTRRLRSRRGAATRHLLGRHQCQQRCQPLRRGVLHRRRAGRSPAATCGQATTDEGRVNFKTIFPGWYAVGRPHPCGERPGRLRVISQWCFPDGLPSRSAPRTTCTPSGRQDTPLAGGTDSGSLPTARTC